MSLQNQHYNLTNPIIRPRLGLDSHMMQVTHSFPFPKASVGPDGQPVAEDMDGQD
ncbi:unnamed protein product, partial [Choristocarpus tenellus]